MTTDALLSLRHASCHRWRGGRSRAVLRNVSVEVRAGDFVAVYGTRGAGKTTLLRIAAGIDRPDDGHVLVDGRDVATLSRRQRNALRHDRIVWVERAGPHSADLTAGAFVALPLYDLVGPLEADRRAAVALERTGALDVADRSWADLWDSERIRVALAQALVREPSVLVVDDPTVGLDVVERDSVLGVLRSAVDETGLGVLMAVPDLPAMLGATEVRLLTRGRLLDAGRDAKIVEFPAHRRRA